MTRIFALKHITFQVNLRIGIYQKVLGSGISVKLGTHKLKEFHKVGV